MSVMGGVIFRLVVGAATDLVLYTTSFVFLHSWRGRPCAGHGRRGGRPSKLFPTIITSWLGVMGRAAITLAPFFRDSAFLQRDKPRPSWSPAAGGAKIEA